MPVFIKRAIGTLFFSIFYFCLIQAQEGGRSKLLFDDDWRFAKGTQEFAEELKYNDNSWRTVNLPHDWSIEDLPPIDKNVRSVMNVATDIWRFKKGDNLDWRETTYPDASWQEVNIPLNWGIHSQYYDEDAYGWYRKTLIIPKKYNSKEFYINLGKIADIDQVYLNGELIGNSGSFPPDYRSAAKQTRQYKVPEKLVDFGKPNTLAIRVYSKDGRGGLYGKSPFQVIRGAYNSHSPDAEASGFTTGGIGWYRKTFKIPNEYKGKAVQLLFEGISKNATFWLNGYEMGSHVNGNTSFWKDLTPYLTYGSKNTLAIKVENPEQSSRWYTGSGIYRHVWMVVSDKIRIDNWGINVSTESVDLNSAALNLTARIKSDRLDTLNVRFRTEIMGPDNEQVVFDVIEKRILAGTVALLKQNFLISNPQLWSPRTPTMYTAVSTINIDGAFLDRVETPFGIRTIDIDSINGFQLSKEPMLLRGGNIHQDNGILGARSFDDAEVRKVKLIKAAGFNAVRCAHNPPAPSFLAACDTLGLLVINEAFDAWSEPKVYFDYNRDFNVWWKEDLKSMIQRDWNHPSVVVWSIGNDVVERFTSKGNLIAQELAGFVQTLDPYRPVTSAVSSSNEAWAVADTFFSNLDIAGYNYQHESYEEDHKRVPNRLILGLESYPSQAYDAWKLTEKLPYVLGDFTWSAMDYLGEGGKGWYSFESEPLDMFPWTTAYCGDLNLIGEKRPQWYYRQTLWEKKPQAYIMVKKPANQSFGVRTRIDWGWQDVERSWSWHGHDMVFFDVYVYSNCDRIKLYQNGKLLAEKRIEAEDKNIASFFLPYKNGSLKAIGFIGKNPVVQDILSTVGIPTKIALKPDRRSLKSNGQDLMFLTVEVQDANNQAHPIARAPLKFEIKGPAEIIAIGNANPQNVDGMTDLEHATYQGKCIAVIRALDKPGEVIVTVSAKGVKSEVLSFLSEL